MDSAKEKVEKAKVVTNAPSTVSSCCGSKPSNAREASGGRDLVKVWYEDGTHVMINFGDIMN